MYSQRFGILQREIKGPTPKAVIVVSTGCGGRVEVMCRTVPLSASSRTPGPV